MTIAQPGLNVPAILPQLIVLVAAGVILLLDAFWHHDDQVPLAVVALVSLAAAYLAVFGLWDGVGAAFGGTVIADGYTLFFDLVLLVAAALSILLSLDYTRRMGIARGGYYALVLLATAGAMLMASAGDLIIAFLGLGMLSIALYVLVGFSGGNRRSQEAAFKYLLLGAFASAFFLCGIALTYGSVGSANLTEIAASVNAGGTRGGGGVLLLLGSGLLIIGLGCKIAAVPFHVWAPDVYEGAPTSVTAFMSVQAKAAGFAALARILLVGLPGLRGEWAPLLAVLAALTMTAGNVAALAQRNVKRMLAYSGIAQSGYLLVALVGASAASISSILFYLAAYTVTNLGAFAGVLWLGKGDREYVALSDYKGLHVRHPWLTRAMILFMLSLTGIPPTAGFIGKFYLLSAAVGSGWVWLVLIATVNSVVSLFYYMRLAVLMRMQEPERELEVDSPSPTLAAALVVCAALVLLLGILPGPILAMAQRAASSVR